MIKFFAFSAMLLLFAACTASPSPSNTGTVAELATEVASSTPSPSATPDNSPEGRGAVLFNTSRGGFACATCHYASERRLIGPGLAGIAERFTSYELEGSVEAYIHESIVNPTAFIALGEPAFPENIMPLNYAALLSEEEIEELIAYILSL